MYCSVVGLFNNRLYYLVDEALTWSEARNRCSQDNSGFLASSAYSVQQFNFLRGLYDEYRAKNGTAIGAWIDGQYDSEAKEWHCKSFWYGRHGRCPNDMKWSHGEPNRNDTEHCILVWYSRRDGVANYRCDARMPAICAAHRLCFVLRGKITMLPNPKVFHEISCKLL